MAERKLDGKSFKRSKTRTKTSFSKQKPGHSSNGSNLLWTLFAFGIAIIVATINRYHVAGMFENDRHFSYLSDMEREMTFRTEMGLYYSYYKTLINAPSLFYGLAVITRDNVTEYGHTINTLKRFNLYPELILASMYRAYLKLTDFYQMKTQECWQTERGQGLEPIVSCEGMGNPLYFYINHVFFLSGLSAGVLFLYGVLLSNSLVGGLLAVAAFFFNHGEATRVQWTPPLRESFGYPLCLLLMLLITFVLKFQKVNFLWTLLIACFTVCFMLSWQFASFVLSTQVGCVFVIYVFGYANVATLKTISRGLLIGLVASYILLFGNEMILTSLFLSSLFSLQFILMAERLFQKLSYRFIIVIAQVVAFAIGTLSIKFVIGSVLLVEDDAHVFDILKSKFTNYSDFHTRLYTCAAEFDFMLPETPWQLAYTLLLPSAILAMLLYFVHFIRIEFGCITERLSPSVKPSGEILYNALQLVVFTIMAILIMRLKLFFTPHLCIFISLLASRKILGDYLCSKISASLQQAFCILLIAGMAVKGYTNIKNQMAIMGEYSNINQERLFQWILAKTEPNAVFAGPMPIMANVKLSTGRAIVNHPHYEDAGLRDRTIKVYSMFSRKSHEQVFDILKQLHVQYYIFEHSWCKKSARHGCSMPELFDLIDIERRRSPPLCDKIQNGDYGPFTLVFENAAYKVLKI